MNDFNNAGANINFTVGDMVRAIRNDYHTTSERRRFIGIVELMDDEYVVVRGIYGRDDDRMEWQFRDFDVLAEAFSKYEPSTTDLATYKEFIENGISRGLKEADLAKAALENYIVNKGRVVEEVAVSEEPEKPKINYSIKNDIKNQDILKKMKSLVDKSRLFKMLSAAASLEDRKVTADMKVVQQYIDRWAEAKYDFFVMFGQKLSIVKSIEFDMDNNEMASQKNALAMAFPKYGYTIDAIRIRDFINNELTDMHWQKYFPSVSRGMKLSKFFALFEDEKFNIEVSKVMQNRKVQGSLTLSIDPYDYLTMSINQHNWSSCHNIKDGCYCTGTLSYMCDEATLIAFKTNGKDYNYNINGYQFTGNSKNWRQCVYFDKASASAIFGRQYPNSSTEIAKELRFFVEDYVANYLGFESKWTMAKNSCKGTYNDLSEFHYSDVNHGFDYNYIKPKESDLESNFEVGSEVYCVKCGENLGRAKERTSCCD